MSPNASRRVALSEKERELLRRLLPTFQIEAEERLKALSVHLLELERTPAIEVQTPIVEVILREVHSLKGAARAVNLTHIEGICQSFESVLACAKRHQLELSADLFDTLHRTVDVTLKLLADPDRGHTAESAEVARRLAGLEGKAGPQVGPGRTERIPAGGSPPPASRPSAAAVAVPPPSPQVALTDAAIRDRQFAQERAAVHSVRVATAKLDALFRQAEELLGVKLAAGQRSADLRDLTALVDVWRREWGKVDADAKHLQRRLEARAGGRGAEHSYAPTAKLVEFLEWNHRYVRDLEGRLRAVARSAERDTQSLGILVDHLLEDAKRVLMLPFSALLEVFPPMVRDLSRSQRKEAELVVHGAHVEIDKRILDELKDPLTHLLRNCIDHGIETPRQRVQLGKPAHGTVTIEVTEVSGDQVEITISDDGGGIDFERLKDAAVRCGVLAAGERATLSHGGAVSLIFHSEVSTSAAVTDLSGRGLGMAIVRDHMEKLGGRVHVETQPHAGTTFRLVLPLTLATLRGIVVEVGEETFVVPTQHVERVVRVPVTRVQATDGQESIPLDTGTVPLVRLHALLERPARAATNRARGHVVALVIAAGERRTAFAVDRVLNEQEVLFKSLGKYLGRVRNVAGATVLGSGQVVTILNVTDLMRSAVGAAASPPRAAPEKGNGAKAPKSILVAEDSMTSRMLLKEILESAGYQVTTAVDGLDALSTLERERFDLLLSDIEMPRMNGFDLTAKVRTHDRYGTLPVVLVTGLESPQDRARGIDVGASAYLVKSHFDQSNLLDVIQRLL